MRYRQVPLYALLIAGSLASSFAAERPEVTRPRATSGDSAVEPDWEERMTVTVGLSGADINGAGHEAIQAAVDYVAGYGGGTVRVMPGTYRLRNAVHLRSGVRLLGEGDKTVLIKEPSATTTLAEDSDWYDQEVTLSDPAGFKVGDGICLRSKDAKTGRQTVLKRTLIARSGSRFKLDKALRENLWQMNGATAATLFPILTGEFIEDITIENLTLDGNRDHNENLDGNYAGCIFLQDCSRVAIRGVTAQNFNGDGISWQICHDVLVENCVSRNHQGLGLHPGSGSQRPIIRNNTLAGNDIGLFFCWGVKYGLAEGNTIEGNRVGISIGHRDTDNLITGNTIADSRAQGLLFRPERGPSFAGHRNRIEGNVLRDNGPEDGAAIEIQGGTESIRIAGNEIVETRGSAKREAVRQGPETKDIVLEGNRVSGFEK
ncbi:MAG: right-handed parallel beta-helix repeat-containing protein [Akkermansiaceae bacterium]|nr:right-handed parallel beta-helix repeat-containing protein [Akkermansiaceae bacterium]MCP5550861.1 right-handed parallel beta-helix repeat-containing protein [Akkermansiaceae bacterium]